MRFLLGVLGLEYERRTVPFEAPRPDWHLAVNPLGGIPALIDGELVLAESNAILRYLAEREGRDDLLPADARRARPGRLAARRRRDDPAARLPRGRRARLRLPPAARHRRRSRRSPRTCPAAIARIAPRLAAFSRLLGDGGYACLGRLTVADCAAMPSLWRLLHAGALQGHARLRAWAETVAAPRRLGPVAAESGIPA